MSEGRYKLPYGELKLEGMDAAYARNCVGLWLRVRADACTSYMEKGILYQLAADAEHSALLERIFKGKPPLDEPPPLSHAYPVYPDD